MRVEESRTFNFNGSFSFVEQQIPLDNRLKLNGISVCDEESCYEQIFDLRQTTPSAKKFYETSDGEKVVIKWYFDPGSIKKRVYSYL